MRVHEKGTVVVQRDRASGLLGWANYFQILKVMLSYPACLALPSLVMLTTYLETQQRERVRTVEIKY